jgi:hypothetical protein
MHKNTHNITTIPSICNEDWGLIPTILTWDGNIDIFDVPLKEVILFIPPQKTKIRKKMRRSHSAF